MLKIHAELYGVTGNALLQRQVDTLQTTVGEMFTKVEQAVIEFRNSLIGRPKRELKMCKFVDAISEVCSHQ